MWAVIKEIEKKKSSKNYAFDSQMLTGRHYLPRYEHFLVD